MGMILMPGGGGGIDLDVVTAAAGDILSGKVIVGADGEPITGTLALTGNAGTGDVLSGKTFYNADAKTKRSGTMPNQGAKTTSLNCGGSYTIPAGYHNGSGTVSANSLASQTSGTATAGNILTGKTAWVNGNKITGTMKNFSSSVQTATTSTLDQTKSCYRINNGYIEVVPAIGHWGTWDYSKSCIKVPSTSALKHYNGKLTSSSSTYGWKDEAGNTQNKYYLTYNISQAHQIVSAFYVSDYDPNNNYFVAGNGYAIENGVTWRYELSRTYSNWNTMNSFYMPCHYQNSVYTVDIWYV